MALKIEYNTGYQGCFVCGQENHDGMKIHFFHDDEQDEMFARFKFPAYMQGYEKVVHGGFISMLLDEVMAKACLHRDMTAVTAQFEVRFKKPIYIEEELHFYGRIAEVRGKSIKTEARCTDAEGFERASARALFFRF
jgi:acyl-coenzyme A thioesterase PaaI-like protein